jgi:hypothetical protein
MKKTLLLLALFGILASCEREMPEDATPLTDSIKDKNWLLIADSTVSSAGTVENNYDLLPGCEKDDLVQFKSNKTLVMDEGATKCNASDPQTMTIGTWALNESSKVLTFTSVEKIDFKIHTLNATNLVLISVETVNGVTFTETATFKVK